MDCLNTLFSDLISPNEDARHAAEKSVEALMSEKTAELLSAAIGIVDDCMSSEPNRLLASLILKKCTTPDERHDHDRQQQQQRQQQQTNRWEQNLSSAEREAFKRSLLQAMFSSSSSLSKRVKQILGQIVVNIARMEFNTTATATARKEQGQGEEKGWPELFNTIAFATEPYRTSAFNKNERSEKGGSSQAVPSARVCRRTTLSPLLSVAVVIGLLCADANQQPSESTAVRVYKIPNNTGIISESTSDERFLFLFNALFECLSFSFPSATVSGRGKGEDRQQNAADLMECAEFTLIERFEVLAASFSALTEVLHLLDSERQSAAGRCGAVHLKLERFTEACCHTLLLYIPTSTGTSKQEERSNEASLSRVEKRGLAIVKEFASRTLAKLSECFYNEIFSPSLASGGAADEEVVWYTTKAFISHQCATRGVQPSYELLPAHASRREVRRGDANEGTTNLSQNDKQNENKNDDKDHDDDDYNESNNSSEVESCDDTVYDDVDLEFEPAIANTIDFWVGIAEHELDSSSSGTGTRQKLIDRRAYELLTEICFPCLQLQKTPNGEEDGDGDEDEDEEEWTPDIAAAFLVRTLAEVVSSRVRSTIVVPTVLKFLEVSLFSPKSTCTTRSKTTWRRREAAICAYGSLFKASKEDFANEEEDDDEDTDADHDKDEDNSGDALHNQLRSTKIIKYILNNCLKDRNTRVVETSLWALSEICSHFPHIFINDGDGGGDSDDEADDDVKAQHHQHQQPLGSTLLEKLLRELTNNNNNDSGQRHRSRSSTVRRASSAAVVLYHFSEALASESCGDNDRHARTNMLSQYFGRLVQALHDLISFGGQQSDGDDDDNDEDEQQQGRSMGKLRIHAAEALSAVLSAAADDVSPQISSSVILMVLSLIRKHVSSTKSSTPRSFFVHRGSAGRSSAQSAVVGSLCGSLAAACTRVGRSAVLPHLPQIMMTMKEVFTFASPPLASSKDLGDEEKNDEGEGDDDELSKKEECLDDAFVLLGVLAVTLGGEKLLPYYFGSSSSSSSTSICISPIMKAIIRYARSEASPSSAYDCSASSTIKSRKEAVREAALGAVSDFATSLGNDQHSLSRTFSEEMSDVIFDKIIFPSLGEALVSKKENVFFEKTNGTFEHSIDLRKITYLSCAGDVCLATGEKSAKFSPRLLTAIERFVSNALLNIANDNNNDGNQTHLFGALGTLCEVCSLILQGLNITHFSPPSGTAEKREKKGDEAVLTTPHEDQHLLHNEAPCRMAKIAKDVLKRVCLVLEGVGAGVEDAVMTAFTAALTLVGDLASTSVSRKSAAAVRRDLAMLICDDVIIKKALVNALSMKGKVRQQALWARRELQSLSAAARGSQ